jgi:cell wall-associated NlpC family hydrolase
MNSPKFMLVNMPAKGDLVLFTDKPLHVGIIIDPDKGTFIGAQTSTGVAETSYSDKPYWKKRAHVFLHMK